MKKIKKLDIRFLNEIRREEIAQLRGAIVKNVGREHYLFHNHVEDSYRFRYPLIQYKRINNQACLVCLEEGVDVAGQLFLGEHKELQIGERRIKLELENTRAELFLINVWEEQFTYTLRSWMPLNSKNYELFKELESDGDKITFLEKVLTGNVLSFAKSMGIFFEQQIECRILRIEKELLTRHKDVKMQLFDIRFKCNVTLPDFIGLGRGVSHGFGTIYRKKRNIKN